MSDALRELLAVFTTEVDTSALEKGNEKVEGFSTKLKELAFTVGEIFALEKLTEFVKGTAESVEQLEVLSNRLGVTTDDIQKFQYAVKLTGGDIATANQGLTLFSKNVGESLNGGGGAQYFQKLGVSVRGANGEIKPTSELLGDVAEGFGKLTSDGERTAVAMGLFGRSGAQLIPILKKGKEGFAEMSAELEKNGGLIDEHTIKVVAKAAEEMNALSFSMNGVKAEIVAALAPAIISLVHGLQRGAAALSRFAQHTTLVQGVMGGLVAIATVATVVWGALNFEFLLIVAGVALLIIVLDDLYGWWTGKDSLFGRIIDKLWGVGASHEALDTLKESIESVKTALGSLDNPTSLASKSVDVLKNAFKGLLDITVLALHEMVGALNVLSKVPDGPRAMLKAYDEASAQHKADFSQFAYDISGGQYGKDAKPVKPPGSESNADAQASQDNLSNADLAAQMRTHATAVRQATAAPPQHVHGGAWPAGSSIHQQNQTTINIHGAKNADEVAEKTGRAVEDAHTNYADAHAAAPGGGVR